MYLGEAYGGEMYFISKVDVYGKCGKFSCSRADTDECYHMLEQKYKFYLAFENSLCKDYVTEKLFNILQ